MKFNQILTHLEKAISDKTSIKNVHRYVTQSGTPTSDDEPKLFLVNRFSRQANVLNVSQPQVVEFVWKIEMLLTCGASLLDQTAGHLDDLDQAIASLNAIDDLQVSDYGTTDFLQSEATKGSNEKAFLIHRKFSVKTQKKL